MRLHKIILSEINRFKINLPLINWRLRFLLYGITFFFSILSLLSVYIEISHTNIENIIFIIAGISGGCSCIYMYLDINFLIKHKIKSGISGNSFTNRLITDYRYRTVMLTYMSLTGNLIFAISNGVYGITYHSVWFGTLSAYYIVLSIMRFMIIQFDKKNSKVDKNQKIRKNEWLVYLMNSCTGGVACLMIFCLGVYMIYFSNKQIKMNC